MLLTRLLFASVLYFAPTLAGWLVTQVRSIDVPLQRLFLINLLAGWTGIGWLVAWGYLVYSLTRQTGGGMAAGSASSWSVPISGSSPTSQSPAWPSEERRQCGTCSGTGRSRCSSCFGQRGRWIQPQTASGTAQWEGCTYCASSGEVQCTSCGGSGYGL